jgi:hypothetical protein
VARTFFKSHRRAAVVIQAVARGAIQRPRYRIDLKEKREEAKLENQLKILQRKLEEAEQRRMEAERRATEKSKEPVVEQEKVDETGKESRSELAATAAPKSSDVAAESTNSPTVGLLTTQQQNLMDESGKMLEYLRKEGKLSSNIYYY